ncbi:MAG: hypothetical protein Q8N00_00455 [Nitrospirota bacterium]|nr:hypothetical protein [Nitrospirota bacterium]MDP3598958.1 hypothetical protein [Nitrospirota bacterium]
MGTILGFLHNLFGGSSPITGYLGSLGILSSGADLLREAVETNGLPANRAEWLILLLSIGVRMAKDANRSNAVNPVAVAHTVQALLLPILLLGLVGCSGTQLQQTQAVLVKLKADAQTVAIAGCANAPLAELLLSTALELLPPGTTIDQIHAGMTLAQPQIAAFCARLQQLHAPAVPVVPAGTPGVS